MTNRIVGPFVAGYLSNMDNLTWIGAVLPNYADV